MVVEYLNDFKFHLRLGASDKKNLSVWVWQIAPSSFKKNLSFLFTYVPFQPFSKTYVLSAVNSIKSFGQYSIGWICCVRFPWPNLTMNSRHIRLWKAAALLILHFFLYYRVNSEKKFVFISSHRGSYYYYC